MQTHYLSCAETAKLVRAALKKSFPATRFSVRSNSYAGGASIDVSWLDGPTDEMVRHVARAFMGARFDGSIDLKINVQNWLMPDGTVAIASNPGTSENGGCISPEREWMPHPEAKLVSFGADYIHCKRSFSAKFLRQAANRLVRKGFEELKTVEFRIWHDGSAMLRNDPIVAKVGESASLLLSRECYRLMIAAA